MNVESSVLVNVFYLVLLVIYVLCKLYHRKKTTHTTLKAILNYRKNPSIIAIIDWYKGKDSFNFNKAHVTEIKK